MDKQFNLLNVGQKFQFRNWTTRIIGGPIYEKIEPFDFKRGQPVNAKTVKNGKSGYWLIKEDEIIAPL